MSNRNPRASEPEMEAPIFILGLPRSGSTVWHNIIANDPDICRIGEMHFLTPWRRDFAYLCRRHVGDLSRDEAVDRLMELMFSGGPAPGLPHHLWRVAIPRLKDPDLKGRIRERILRSDRSLGSIFKSIIEEIARSRGKSRCCVKFPVWLSYIPDLLRWYPRCRIVHITRDPRATAMSKTNDPGGTRKLLARYPYLHGPIRKAMISYVIAQYVWAAKLHQQYRGLDNYRLFRFEDLLVDSNGTVASLCEFVGIPFKESLLDLRSAQQSSITGVKTAGFDRQAGVRWMRVIKPSEERMITLLTARAMRRLGFDPIAHRLYADADTIDVNRPPTQRYGHR